MRRTCTSVASGSGRSLAREQEWFATVLKSIEYAIAWCLYQCLCFVHPDFFDGLYILSFLAAFVTTFAMACWNYCLILNLLTFQISLMEFQGCLLIRELGHVVLSGLPLLSPDCSHRYPLSSDPGIALFHLWVRFCDLLTFNVSRVL